jgi:cell division transport system permease protein
MMKATPEADQMTAFFGTFSVGFWGLLGIFLVAVSVAVLTGLTSRITVMRHVGQLESYGNGQKL